MWFVTAVAAIIAARPLWRRGARWLAGANANSAAPEPIGENELRDDHQAVCQMQQSRSEV